MSDGTLSRYNSSTCATASTVGADLADGAAGTIETAGTANCERYSMPTIRFSKMSGSGNDFIVIDNRAALFSNLPLPSVASQLCRRQEGIGADGLVLIETSRQADFRWRFFNADGSQADMCGNGGRCAARFAYEHQICGSSLSFETGAGIIHAEVRGSNVRIQLPQPHDLFLHRSISVQDIPLHVQSINTGVPHVIVRVTDLESAPVTDLGRAIRFHPEFQPAGTNVNFIRVDDRHTIQVRTYERGVEDETLACGTGSVASALVAAAVDEVDSPVCVKTRGGEILTVSFNRQGVSEFIEVFLEGETCLAFEGVLCIDLLRRIGIEDTPS